MATKKEKPTKLAKRYKRRVTRGKKGYTTGVIRAGGPGGRVMGFGVTKTTKRRKKSVVTRPVYKIPKKKKK